MGVYGNARDGPQNKKRTEKQDAKKGNLVLDLKMLDRVDLTTNGLLRRQFKVYSQYRFDKSGKFSHYQKNKCPFHLLSSTRVQKEVKNPLDVGKCYLEKVSICPVKVSGTAKRTANSKLDENFEFYQTTSDTSGWQKKKYNGFFSACRRIRTCVR